MNYAQLFAENVESEFTSSCTFVDLLITSVLWSLAAQ